MMNGMNLFQATSMAPSQWRAGIYCRLSKDDDLQGESASIGNQRDLLTNYCKSQGWTIVQVYQDDGYTGLNTDRPDLQRMLNDVRMGVINLVITKDLSRLGRNYLDTGYLIEKFFPKNRVRYIAFNDGIDTEGDNNDIAPFKNVLNELYSKDISKKVHSSYMVAAQKGKFTGVVPPFGYLKDTEEKGHLIIDNETAPYMREIFRMAAEGRGPNHIRRWLEENKVPCPAWWNRQRGFRNTMTKWEKSDPENGRFVWDFSIIKDMLMNPVYMGAMASQKRYYKFKAGVLGEKKPDEWIIIENCHEPIVDKNTFMIVQSKMQSRTRPRSTGEFSLFAGILKCGECGKSLTYRESRPNKEPIPIYCCKTYNAYGKGHCTQHRVPMQLLKDKVLSVIRDYAQKVNINPDDVTERLNQIRQSKEISEHETLVSAIAQDEDRLKMLGKMFAQLYEDRLMGSISEENFDMMRNKTQNEQRELESRIAANKAQLSAIEHCEDQPQQWINLIKDYTDIEDLDAETLNRLVKRIVVHEEIDKDHVRHQKIEIYFNFQPVPATDEYIPEAQRPYLHPDHSAQYISVAQ